MSVVINETFCLSMLKGPYVCRDKRYIMFVKIERIKWM